MQFMLEQRTLADNILTYLWNEDAVAIMKFLGLIDQEQINCFGDLVYCRLLRYNTD